ncbi:MAG: SBBP repeat-containing protein [Anaerolineae bacterium]|jgi:uncharacterized repeat protein (TIGR01451 family)
MKKGFLAIGLIASLTTLLALSGGAQSTSAAQPPPPMRNSGIQPLATDQALLWNTFLGGAEWDDGYGVAVDTGGNIYVAGTSQGTWGSPTRPYGGVEDAFVAKLDSNGALLWNTFLGSATGSDYGRAIAVDGTGNVYVAGESLYTWGSPLNAHTGNGHDAFVAKLNSSGALQWNTFMGAPLTSYPLERGYALAVDGTGVYVAGESASSWGAPVDPFPSPGISEKVFVAKLNSSGVRLWNNFVGDGNQADYAKAIVVNGASVYVAGYSKATWGTPVRPHSGDFYGDAFVAQFNSSTGALQWNTFLGGARRDDAYGIAVGGSNVYVSGRSLATWGTPLNPHAGSDEEYDAYVARLNSGGTLQWHTFMGAPDYEADIAYAIAVDGTDIYVAGDSTDTWGTPTSPYTADHDAFAARLSNSGTLQWNTFLGGDDWDEGHAIAVAGTDLYVVGSSNVTYGDWGTPIRSGAGSYDAFVANLGEARPDLSGSSKQVSPTTIEPIGTVWHTLEYAITLANTGNLEASGASLTDSLPADLTLSTGPTCTGGTCDYNAGPHTITWSGNLAPGTSVTINYAGQVSVPIGTEDTIIFENTAQVDDGTNPPFTLTARSTVNLRRIYLPLVLRGS